MNLTSLRLSRRRVLAGLGTSGVLLAGVGAGIGPFARTPPYTRYTYASTGEDSRVRVSWYETYNDELIGTQNGTTGQPASAVLDPAVDPGPVEEAAPHGPSITLPNVLPGDFGTIAVGLVAESLPAGEPGIEYWVRASLVENAENGVTEPESKHRGEDDPLGTESGTGASGELADAVRVEVWEDSGTAIGGLGACDGRLGFDEQSIFPVGTTLRGAVSDLDPGRRLGSSVGSTCFAEGDALCLGLNWWIPGGARDDIQTDSLVFDLQFAGASCDAGNPFATGGGP